MTGTLHLGPGSTVAGQRDHGAMSLLLRGPLSSSVKQTKSPLPVAQAAEPLQGSIEAMGTEGFRELEGGLVTLGPKVEEWHPTTG